MGRPSIRSATSSELIVGALLLTVAIATAMRPHEAAGAWPGSNGQIVFVNRNDGHLWVAGSDGRALRRITSGTTYRGMRAWSPDGRRIAFTAIARPGTTGEIFTLGADGRQLRRLTRNRVWDSTPAWSPDGSRVVFVSHPPRRPGARDLYVMSASGADRRRVTRLSRASVSSPAWSPDGTTIAYSVDGAVYLLSSRGGVRGRRLATGLAPTWSPDGSALSFRRGQRAFVMRPDGSDIRPLPAALELDP